MFARAKGKQQKQVRQLQCQEQCIDHFPYYLSGLSRALFFRQPFLKLLYTTFFSSRIPVSRWTNPQSLLTSGFLKFPETRGKSASDVPSIFF